MDAYTEYMLQQSHAKLAELRRETAEHAMSRAARQGRRRWWPSGRRRRPDPRPVTVQVRCPACQAPLALAVEELVSAGA